MSSGKTQEEVLDSLISNATTNTAVAVMDIKDTMVQNLKNGTGLGKVPTIEELTAARKRRKEKSSKKGFSKKEESRRENATIGTAEPGADCAQSWDLPRGDDNPMYVCKKGAAPFCTGYIDSKRWGKCTEQNFQTRGTIKQKKGPHTDFQCQAKRIRSSEGSLITETSATNGIDCRNKCENNSSCKGFQFDPPWNTAANACRLYSTKNNKSGGSDATKMFCERHPGGGELHLPEEYIPASGAAILKYGQRIFLENGKFSNANPSNRTQYPEHEGKNTRLAISGAHYTAAAHDGANSVYLLSESAANKIAGEDEGSNTSWRIYLSDGMFGVNYNYTGDVHFEHTVKIMAVGLNGEFRGWLDVANNASYGTTDRNGATPPLGGWRVGTTNVMGRAGGADKTLAETTTSWKILAPDGSYGGGDKRIDLEGGTGFKLVSAYSSNNDIGLLAGWGDVADGKHHVITQNIRPSSTWDGSYFWFPRIPSLPWKSSKSGDVSFYAHAHTNGGSYFMITPAALTAAGITPPTGGERAEELAYTSPSGTVTKGTITLWKATTKYSAEYAAGDTPHIGMHQGRWGDGYGYTSALLASHVVFETGGSISKTYLTSDKPFIAHAHTNGGSYFMITPAALATAGIVITGDVRNDIEVTYTSPTGTKTHGKMSIWKLQTTSLPEYAGRTPHIGRHQGRWRTPVGSVVFETGGSIVKITAAQLAAYKEGAAAITAAAGTDTATAIAAGYTKVKEKTGYCREEIGQPIVHMVAHATRTMAEFIEACEADTTCTHFHTCCAAKSGATTVYWGNLVTSCANVNKWNPPNPEKGQPRGSLDTAYTIYRKQGATVDPLTEYDGRSESQKLVANMDAPPPGYAIQLGMYLGVCITGDNCKDYTTIDAAATACNQATTNCSGIAKKTTGVYEIRASPPALLETGTTEISYVKNPPISDAGGTAMAWAQNRIDNALAITSRTCGGTPVRPTCSLTEHGEAACNARKNMFDDLQNPILRNLVINDDQNPGGAPPHLQLRTESGILNPKGIGWLRIPTSNVNNLLGPWSDPIQANVDEQAYEPKHNVSLSYITMLIANKYTAAQSKEIFDILSPEGTIYAPKLSTGRGFIFTKEGHIRIWQKESDSPNDTMYNPLINMSTPDGESDASGKTDNVNDRLIFGTPRTDLRNTMADSEGAQGIGSYTAGARINGPLFAMSSRIVMNKALTYILYTPDITPSETSQYYLLYNPIHGEEFKRFYQSILQAKKTEETGTRYTSSWGNGNAYPVDRIRAYDRSGCLSSIDVPSYTRIIARYCNAFKIPGFVATQSASEMIHYADPLCPIMMGTVSSIFHFALGHNMAHESLRRSYYRISRTDTYEQGYRQFMMAVDALTGGQHPSTSMSWACDNHNISTPKKDIQDYMSDIGMFGQNNTSFVQIMGHAIVNSETAWVDDDAKQAIYRRVSAAATRDGAPSATVDAAIAAEAADKLSLLGKPVCLVAAKSFISCTNTINIAGNVGDSNLGQKSVCGPQPARVVGTNPPPTKEEICEADPSSCVDPAECETAEGSEEVASGEANATITYTGCCYGALTGELLGAKTDAGCGGVDQGSSAANELEAIPTNKSSAATITVMVEGLMEKIAKAGKVGTTAKTAYPTDLVIGAAAEEISSKLSAGVSLGETIDADLKVITVVISEENTAVLVKAQADADKLAIVSTDLEKLGSDMAILIASTYMYGIKKMYLIGGAIGLVVLILLIVLLKK